MAVPRLLPTSKRAPDHGAEPQRWRRRRRQRRRSFLAEIPYVYVAGPEAKGKEQQDDEPSGGWGGAHINVVVREGDLGGDAGRHCRRVIPCSDAAAVIPRSVNASIDSRCRPWRPPAAKVSTPCRSGRSGRSGRSRCCGSSSSSGSSPNSVADSISSPSLSPSLSPRPTTGGVLPEKRVAVGGRHADPRRPPLHIILHHGVPDSDAPDQGPPAKVVHDAKAKCPCALAVDEQVVGRRQLQAGATTERQRERRVVLPQGILR
mmetsp:Transcript_4076/g.9942  ORF Transcript_4076/g.9942 Transcript_4076/m.9942 type:complete len:261 (-) Transcript_4076:1258-2040(-)